MVDEANVDKQVQLDPQLMVMFTEDFREQVLMFFSHKFVVRQRFNRLCLTVVKVTVWLMSDFLKWILYQRCLVVPE